MKFQFFQKVLEVLRVGLQLAIKPLLEAEQVRGNVSASGNHPG